MIDVIKARSKSLYMTTSRFAGYDPLALLSFKAEKCCPTLTEIRFLVVNILPDRPIDMFHILKRVRTLCDDLRATK